MLARMASYQSLFSCPASAVTLDRVRALAGQNMPESLTLEYKEAFSPSLVKSVAAMANTYGGIILVGVRDQAGPDRLAGVPEDVMAQVVNACHEKLEPPWEPEIIPVPLEDAGSRRFILVVRVDHTRAPRPVLIGGAAPVRLHGRNATADRSRLAQLFSEAPASDRAGRRLITAPNMPTRADGSADADLILRSGMVLLIGDEATWRPLPENVIDQLARELDRSPTGDDLRRWATSLGVSGEWPFRRSGFNRSRHARLAWQAATDGDRPSPAAAIAAVDLPTPYGTTATSLSFTIDVTLNVRSFLGPGRGGGDWRVTVPDLHETITALLAALTSQEIAGILGDLAAIDPILVPQPGNLFLQTGPGVGDLLHPQGLRPIEDTGQSHGAHVLANPALDLSDPAERQSQVDDWLQQIALDAGLSGMQNLLSQYHESISRSTAS